MKSAAILVVLAALASACSDDKSVVVVSVSSNKAPIARVAQLRVRATSGPAGEYKQTLYYPEKPLSEDALLQLNDTSAVTFSLSFRSMFKGSVGFEIEALDPALTILGSGEGTSEVGTGQVVYSTVKISPPCDPLQPAVICGEKQNCALVCDPQNQQAKLMCVATGLKNPGDICSDIADCTQGSECFTFTCSGTAIKTCRKFCASDADCGAGSACNLSITCSASTTQARICSRPCNPTGSATDGCAPGLNCFIYGGEVTDCACRPATRSAGIGQACSGDDTCMPGLTCVDRGTVKTCRALCTLATPACPSGSTCTQLFSPVYQIYGACL